VSRLLAFAEERNKITLKRAGGEKPPWTTDTILANYRFCSVYRELDKVTVWIRENWREPYKESPDLWFAMCVARLFNLPECLQDVGWPLPWNPKKFLEKLQWRKQEEKRIFNAAYIVSTNGIAEDKVDYICNRVLHPMWLVRDRLRPKQGDTLNSYHMLLGQMQGFGSFMTAQVIADLKYVEPLHSASDWWTFAASGPGSRRGLNYVRGRDRNAPWTEEEWRLDLGRLRQELLPLFKAAHMPEPHAQDVQNLLCEWSKYWRAATEGKMPKQRYRWEAR
jgi:hypothetical protein